MADDYFGMCRKTEKFLNSPLVWGGSSEIFYKFAWRAMLRAFFALAKRIAISA
ncbi:hypothetical protein [Sphingobium yanoikuyae]|uniref:hypothetical protein n=1 Tax=Sphingobium yanoikuyae TaxID=13690 RepID=UPI0028AE8C4B|nr:hypothetical protein [Sphingobium yanoikuyae]